MKTSQQAREDHAVFIYSAEPNSERHVRALCGAFDEVTHDSVRPFAVLGYEAVAGPQRCPACEEVAAVERRAFAEVPPDEAGRRVRAWLMKRLRYGSYGRQREDMALRVYGARHVHPTGFTHVCVLLNWTETPPAFYFDVDSCGALTVRDGRDPREWMRANWPCEPAWLSSEQR